MGLTLSMSSLTLHCHSTRGGTRAAERLFYILRDVQSHNLTKVYLLHYHQEDLFFFTVGSFSFEQSASQTTDAKDPFLKQGECFNIVNSDKFELMTAARQRMAVHHNM